MKIIASNKIKIEEYTQEVLDYCRAFLVLDNPEYYKKQAQGRWLGNTQKQFVLYERVGKDLLLPFGCLQDLWKRFAKNASFSCEILPVRSVLYQSHIELYPYQEIAVQSVLRAKNGVLVSPCGSGKTQMALETIARIGGKALWLTHTGELLTQSMERAKSCFDLPHDAYGTITAGKVNIGSAITFATVQTMANIDVRQYAHEWDVVVVDECHKAIGTPTKVMQFYKVLSNLSARYKIGVTATPKRADGLEMCMTSLLGDIVHTIPKEEVKRYTCPVRVEKRETGYKPNLNVVLAGDGTIVYSDLIKDLTENEERNKKIAEDVFNILYEDQRRKILILSDRVEHLSKLRTMICEDVRSENVKQLKAISNSKKAREERRQILKDLNDGKINVVLATYQLAKEGLDVPKLDYVVFATPQKDETTVVQSAGRVGRKADGKEFGTVIDYVDDFGLLLGYSKKRNNYYKKLEYEIIV
jgi:superfamily II DNA or RNA helicase